MPASDALAVMVIDGTALGKACLGHNGGGCEIVVGNERKNLSNQPRQSSYCKQVPYRSCGMAATLAGRRDPVANLDRAGTRETFEAAATNNEMAGCVNDVKWKRPIG